MASLLMGLSYTTGLFELLIVGRLLIGINAGENDRNTKKRLFEHLQLKAKDLKMFSLFRHRSLCSADVPGGNSAHRAPRHHGNGHLYFHHRWHLARTSGWPPVRMWNDFQAISKLFLSH